MHQLSHMDARYVKVAAKSRAKSRTTLEIRTYEAPEWDEVVEEWLGHIRANFEESTWRYYRNSLNQVVRWMKSEGVSFANFTARDMDQYLTWRKSQPTQRVKHDPPQLIIDAVASGKWVSRTRQEWADELGVEVSTVKRYRAIAEKGLASGRLAATGKRATVVKHAVNRVSDSTRRKEAITMRLFSRFAYRRGYLERDMLKDYSIPADNQTIPVTPTEDDLREMVTIINRMWNPALNPKVKSRTKTNREFFRTRNLAIFMAAARTGARIDEILSLKFADYDIERMQVTFRNTKTDVDRQVPILPDLVDVISEYLKYRPKLATSHNVFVNECGEHVTVNAWEKTFLRFRAYANQCDSCLGTGRNLAGAAASRRAKLCGRGWQKLPAAPCPDCGGSGERAESIIKWSMHGTRHYAATKLCERAGIDHAAEILGHTNLATTQRYNHITDARKRRGMEVADLMPLDRGEKPVMVNKRSEANRKRKLV